MHRFLVGLMTAVVAGLVAVAPSEATVTPGIASVISPADGREVDVAYNADGDELVMIWVAQVGGGGDAIWAQRFTGAGEPVGVAKNVVSTGAAVRSPSIEFVPQHSEYYLAWIAYDDTNSTVEGKRITDSLSDLGGPFSVAGGEHAGSVDLAQRWAGNMWFIYDAAPGTGGLAAGEYEVFRKIYSPSRTLVDDQLRISEAGSDGDAAVDTTGPAVAWGDVDHMSYLIAWEQQGAIHGQVHHEVNGAPGVDRDDFAISLHDGASDPAIAYSKERHEWLVVYAAGGHVYGRVVSNVAPWDLVGGEIDLSAHADATAQDPSVAWNATGAEWMATWSGTSAIAPGEREVYAQHLGAGHTVVHDDDPLIRMSVMGPHGDLAREARRPAISYAPTAGRFFTAWEADHDADDVFRAYATLGAATDVPDPPVFPPPAGGPAVAGPNVPSAPGSGGAAPGSSHRSSASLPGGTTIDLPAGGTTLGVKVACGAAAACAGTVRAETVKTYASAAAAKPKAKKKPVLLGRARFAIAAGKAKTITLRLSKRARALLAKQRTLKARVTVALDQGATVRRTITIKIKKKKTTKHR